ncbi:hypothetical protein VCNHCC008D_002469 [Vibrio cholerae O1 str. NHCC-008D]|nr:hypothetical protein VCNHCC008D_002469 [Vibrio cholerae O1 str. NHCC-008D]
MVAQKVINALTSHVFINVDELDLSSDFVHGRYSIWNRVKVTFS